MSGLVAMLAAAEIIGNSTLAASFQRRTVFAALAGEPWGYMGSKRLLWELANRENSTEGLALANIEQVPQLPYYKLEPNTMLHGVPGSFGVTVRLAWPWCIFEPALLLVETWSNKMQVIELGQVGRADNSSGQQRLYFHSQGGAGFGDAGPIWDALQKASQDVPEVRSTFLMMAAATVVLHPCSSSHGSRHGSGGRQSCLTAGEHPASEQQQPRHPAVLADVVPEGQQQHRGGSAR